MRREPDADEERPRARLGVHRREPEHAARCLGHVPEHAQVRKEMEALEHHADARPDGAERRGVGALAHAGTEGMPGDLDLALAEGRQVVERAEEGRLPASRRAEDRDHLAPPHREIDAAEDVRLAPARPEAAHRDDGAHAGAGASRRSSRRARRASG